MIFQNLFISRTYHKTVLKTCLISTRIITYAIINVTLFGKFQIEKIAKNTPKKDRLLTIYL